MTIETALQSQVRDGYRLVGTSGVAIPVALVNVRLLVEGFTEIPDSTRYVLALIAEGIDREQLLSELLGLKTTIMRGVVTDAILSRYIRVTPRESFELTEGGYHALAETTQLTLSHRTVTIGVDRMTERAFPWRSIPHHLKLTPRELKQHNDLNPADTIHQVPHPRRNPGLDDLTAASGAIDAVTSILNEEQVPPRLVEILSIEGNIKKLFRVDATAMRIMPLSGGSREWDFLIGGIRSETHAQAFVKFEKNNRRTLIPEPPDHPLDHLAYGLTAEELSRFAEVDWAETTRQLELRRRQATLSERAKSAPPEVDTSRLESALEATNEAMNRPAQETTESGLPAVLYVHKHRPFLIEHLSGARRRALIVSPWVSPDVFDEQLEDAIRAALDNGAYVGIRYGYENKGVSRSIRARFDSLASYSQGFSHKDLGNSHVKLLAVDDDFVTSGSFNWLSFLGSPERTFREEKTFIVQDRGVIDNEFHEYFTAEHYEASLPPRDDTRTTANAVLFVEGWTDMRYLELATKAADRQDLIAGIEIRHVGGAEKVVRNAIAFAHNFPDTPMLALFDSDEIGRKCAKDVRNYVARGNRATYMYGEVFKTHVIDTEAENLFPVSLIERFVSDHSDERVVFDLMAVNQKTGERRYQINKDSKDLLVNWLESNLELEDTTLWLELLDAMRKKLELR